MRFEIESGAQLGDDYGYFIVKYETDEDGEEYESYIAAASTEYLAEKIIGWLKQEEGI